MAVIGEVEDAFVEDGRVIAIMTLGFSTHNGRYRADITPPIYPNEDDVIFTIDLEKFAADAIGSTVRIDNPSVMDDLIEATQ